MPSLFVRLQREGRGARAAHGGDTRELADAPAAWSAARSGSGRLIAINRFFPPDAAPTARLLGDLVRHIAAQGVSVTVIASGPSMDGPWPDDEGLRIEHVACRSLGLRGLPGRVVAYLTFAVAAALRLLVAVRPGDTVLVKTDPPLMSLLVVPIAVARGASVVNWCQDLFPEVAVAVGVLRPGGMTQRLLQWLRNRSLRVVRRNVAISRAMAARLRDSGVPAERIVVIPNWADEDWVRPRTGSSVRRRLGLRADSFVIGYAGTLGRVHDPAPLRALMQRLRHRSDVEFLIVGSGFGMKALRRAVDEDGLDERVRFLPPQPRVLLAETLAAADLHLVGLRPECEGLSFPSKLYGVLAAARPVLFIGDLRSEVAGIVTSGGAGLAVDGSDPEAMAEAVTTLRREAGLRGRSARLLFERRYRRSQAMAAWERCLELAPAAKSAPAAGPMVGGTGIEPVTPRV